MLQAAAGVRVRAGCRRELAAGDWLLRRSADPGESSVCRPPPLAAPLLLLLLLPPPPLSLLSL